MRSFQIVLGTSAVAAATLLSSSSTTQVSAFSSTANPLSSLATKNLGSSVVSTAPVATTSARLAADDASSAAADADTPTTAAVTNIDYKTQWVVGDGSSSFETTESGLMYQDTITGSGESPDEGSTIEIHYSFWFDEFEDANDTTGKKYFSTRNDRNPQNNPLGFQYGKDTKILKGWLEGMKTMKQGGTRVLIIPPELGYGDAGCKEVPGYPTIPPNSYLRFEVEMVKVDNSAWTKFRRMVPKPSSLLDV